MILTASGVAACCNEAERQLYLCPEADGSRQGVVFMAVILLASRMFGYSGVLLSQAVSDVITAALAVWLFGRGIYREVK